MNTWGIIGIVYGLLVIAWCFFILFNREKVMSPKNSKTLNIVFLVLSIIIAPICWIIGLVSLVQEKKQLARKDLPQPVPKKFRNYLKKDTVFYHNKSISLAAYNKLTGNSYTLEQIYGRRYVESLTEDDLRQFDNEGIRGNSEFDNRE